jgi:hypothetical protein
MFNSRLWMWTGRVAALLVAIVVPACDNSGTGNGSGNPAGILWLSNTSSGTSVGGPTPTGSALWVDPNSGLGGGPIGLTALIQSTDDVTYNRFNASTRPPPFTQYIFYILGLEHPLSTDTSSTAITARESELQGLLNSVRTTLLTTLALPNSGGGGGGGGGGAGGALGGGIGLTQGSIPGHARGTKAARAHCKHSAYFHPGPLPGGAPAPTGWTIPGGRTGAPLFFPAQSNAEGDLLLYTDVGTPAYQDPATIHGSQVLALNVNANYGRLGKVGVVAARNGWCEFSYSGVQYREALDVFNAMLQDAPDILHLDNWTNVVPGHWRGGTESFYWNVLYIIFPNPPY